MSDAVLSSASPETPQGSTAGQDLTAPGAQPTAQATDASRSPATPAVKAGRTSESQDRETAIQAAFRTAKDRLGAAKAETHTSAAGGEQAGAASPDSTRAAAPPAPGGDPAKAQPTVAQDATSGQDPTLGTAASTAPPANWPSERREQFGKLPPEAQRMTLDFYQDMQRGFTKATQGVAEIKQHAEEYRTLQQAAQKDPQGFLRNLAAQLGVDLPGLDDEAPPEFGSAAELAKWTADKARREVERRFASLQRESESRSNVARQRAVIERELAKAMETLPNFAAVRDEVLQTVVDSRGALTLEQAYHLRRMPDLLAAETRAQRLEADLKAAQATEEARKKSLGALVQGRRGTQEPAKAAPQGPMSRFEEAAARAKSRISQVA
jgi:hypothetical protein